MGSYGTGPDPKIGASRFYTTDNIRKGAWGNVMGYSNPKVDELLAQAAKEFDHEKRAERAELAARLNHLRHTELRTLSRVQRHEDGAHQIADRKAHDAPRERQCKDRDRETAGDDGQEHEVRAEPHSKEIGVRTVPVAGGDRLNGGKLETIRLFAVAHDHSIIDQRRLRRGGDTLAAMPGM